MEAESAAINSPPPFLERIVLLFIPPAARETVGGDLCEMYRTPLQYGSQALRTLPFVVASHVRRNADLPLLMLQGLTFFAVFGGLFAVPAQSCWTDAALATLATLLFLLLYDVYKPPERASPRQAILETIVLTAFATFPFPQALLGFVTIQPLQGFWWLGYVLLGSFTAMCLSFAARAHS